MSELKHGFGAAKMNKDADERTVPNGEYRDALNVQIVTSDGSDVGTLQTLLGNSKINSTFQGTLSSQAKCVGSVADEANNKIYYFVSDKVNYTDYIFEYTINNSLTPIVVDKYRVDITTSLNYGGNNNRIFAISTQGQPSSNNVTNVRPGMSVIGNFLPSTSVTLANKIKIIRMKHLGSDWEVYMDDFSSTNIFFGSSLSTIAGTDLTLQSDRVLNFDNDNLITGINVIDETIYWTDGDSEPKKININNLQTNQSGLYHTKFLVKDNYNNLITYASANAIDFRDNPDYLKEEHLTVIKKSPLYPPTLLFSNTSDFRFDNGSASVLTSSMDTNFVDFNDDPLEIGSVVNVIFTTLPNYKVGDKILLRRYNDFEGSLEINNYEIIVELLEFVPGIATAKLKISFIAGDLPGHVVTNQGETFYSILKQEKPLYEFKFPRFAYRYKYQDDQYSCYSPFSEPAFLPGGFNYKPKDGYNIGMVNTLRSLYVMDFVPDQDTLPKDVVAVDIVYKESNSNNVYVVQTIEHGDSEWIARGSDINTDTSGDSRTKGALLITSEMVKAAVASNQLLRPWDNVPRTARAQDMVGNRIVYANYKQNYNLN
jgi:hypothetical protein